VVASVAGIQAPVVAVAPAAVKAVMVTLLAGRVPGLLVKAATVAAASTVVAVVVGAKALSASTAAPTQVLMVGRVQQIQLPGRPLLTPVALVAVVGWVMAVGLVGPVVAATVETALSS
jgi:hypothetical protein